MTEDLKKVLQVFDADTVDYLKNNAVEVFTSLAKGEPLPKGMQDYMDIRLSQRKLLVETIEKVNDLDPIKD